MMKSEKKIYTLDANVQILVKAACKPTSVHNSVVRKHTGVTSTFYFYYCIIKQAVICNTWQVDQ